MQQQLEISEKKRAIFESALELIKKHGFHGAPMSKVAENANVATGTVYHYFESKDTLISELYSFYRTRLVEVVNNSLACAGSYRSQFDAVWKGIFQFYAQNPNVMLFFEQYLSSPFSSCRQPKDFEQRPLHEFISRGINMGEIKNIDPEILLPLIMSNSMALARLHRYGNVSVGRHELEQVLNTIWNGIGK